LRSPLTDDSSHLRLREFERRRAAAFLANPAARAAVDSDIASRAQVAPPAVGETVAMRVINRSPENPDLCSNPLMRSGRVAAVTEHAILVEDVLNPVALSAADIERIA